MYLLVANAFVLGIVAYAAFLDARMPDFYYASVQEDEYVEWASFWAFLLASFACGVAAARYRNAYARVPWYFCGVALFCFLIAMEEISWGQRLLGYRPPVYFLENNYQQELNIHNVIATDYRKLVLQLSIIGYGVALPLLGLFGPLRRALERLGVVVTPAGLLPAFVATFLVYYIYPWSHSGEWVELMLGAGTLASVLPQVGRSPKPAAASSQGWAGRLLLAWVVVVGLGLVSGAASRAQRDAHPETVQAARDEVEALRRDFESGRAVSRCNLHKRLYTFVVQYEQPGLLSGAFSGLQQQGLPEERAEFLLDPWNSPYWIRDRCNRATGQRVMFIYSFGPNRRRDSAELEIRGDDIGAYVFSP